MSIDMDEYGERRVCDECVSDPFLAQEIEESGAELECFYCSQDLLTWPLSEVAERVELAFEQHYSRTTDQADGYQLMLMADKESDYWFEREGEQTVYAIMNALDSSEALAQDLQLYLEEMHGDMESWQMGEECEFASDAHYEDTMPSDGERHQDWYNFEHALKRETRFFNQKAHQYLQSIFSGLEDMRTSTGDSVIIDAGPEQEITGFYRARVFYSDRELEKGLMRPDLELGPPPSEYARAGRMNAHGISVFYGADTIEGAIAEVRPAIGSQTLVGRFDLVRPVKLLDFRILQSLSERGSIFDPEYATRLTRMTFLRSLKSRISRPVMPTDEEVEYLATQAIIDFLANGLSVELDGVVFPSAQTNESTTNVVLFHRSSKVVELDLPQGAELSAHTSMSTEDGPERDYCVWEKVPPNGEEEEAQSAIAGPFAGLYLPTNDLIDPLEDKTLCLDMESLSVQIVTAATYETDDHTVQRHRMEKQATSVF